MAMQHFSKNIQPFLDEKEYTLSPALPHASENKHKDNDQKIQNRRSLKTSNTDPDPEDHSTNELVVIKRELRDQKASIANQSNMITELAKNIDTSNTRFKNLSETIQAFLTTLHRQESGQGHTAPTPGPHDPKIPSARTIRSNDSSRRTFGAESLGTSSTYTKEPRYNSQYPSMTQVSRMSNTKTYAGSPNGATNPLLPTPNFSWYDSVTEEARPPPLPGRAGQSARQGPLGGSRYSPASSFFPTHTTNKRVSSFEIPSKVSK